MATKKTSHKLKAEKRKVTGKKVKALRQAGVLPANIYGKKVKSQAVQLDLKDFLPVYGEAGETGLVELTLKGETKARPILISSVHFNPVTDQPLHADFYQVSLKEKVTAEIPVELVGESLAVKDKLGILVQQLSEVEVEALPTELPEKFTVDIGQLKQVEDAVTVGDLKIPKGVEVLAEKNEILARISPLTKEEEAAPPPEVSAEDATEGETDEAAAGPAEGEGAEGKDEEKKPGEVKKDSVSGESSKPQSKGGQAPDSDKKK